MSSTVSNHNSSALISELAIGSNLIDGFLDSSRLLTLASALFLVVYGSKRALSASNVFYEDNIEVKDKKEQASHTIQLSQAVFLPIGASLALLTMFLFFNVFQFFFMISSIILSVFSFAYLVLPLCEIVAKVLQNNTEKFSIGCCGRYTLSQLLSLTISISLVLLWIFTGHWILMDILGFGLCITMLSFVRLPNLKVATLLLCGLLVYDVFWVFCSEYFFNDNVMVKVATRPAYNPMNYVVKKLNLASLLNIPPTISLPGKLMFPSSRYPNRFGMLGLGDIVMPGLVCSFVLTYETNVLQTPRKKYFNICIWGYMTGLIVATMLSELYHTAQPALLYLVPSTLIPMIVHSMKTGDFKGMWSYHGIEKLCNDQLLA